MTIIVKVPKNKYKSGLEELVLTTIENITQEKPNFKLVGNTVKAK